MHAPLHGVSITSNKNTLAALLRQGAIAFVEHKSVSGLANHISREILLLETTRGVLGNLARTVLRGLLFRHGEWLLD